MKWIGHLRAQRRHLWWLLGALGTFALLWTVIRWHAGHPLEQLEQNWHEERNVLDRHGHSLRTLPSEIGVRGSPIALEAVGDRLLSATLVSEDRRFFEHAGVDYAAVVRALGQNARQTRVVSGASTITQQLVKLLDNQGQPATRSLWTKVMETARAQNLEQSLDKREILRAYLNRLNYGNNLVGPDRAARAMFGKPPHQLSWAEAALLAVLPRAPSALNPYRQRGGAIKRQRALLRALERHGFLSELDLERALGTELRFERIEHPFEAPHWVQKVLDSAQAGSPKLQTTLDRTLQRAVEAIVRSHQQRLAERGADNAAAIVVDNQSGEILAYVGSYAFTSPQAGQVDHANARRQPGSTLKPFVYALAFARGLDIGGPLADVPSEFGSAGDRYAPENFDHVFHGPVSAHTALASSLNVPAVALAAKLPQPALLDLLRTLGISSLNRPAKHYGLSLALGSGEVTLTELVTAYATLARHGSGLRLRAVVEDARALGLPQPGQPVLDRASVAQVSHSLSDPLARVLGLGGRGPFEFGFPTAVKTGTSSGHRDAWTIGYTAERTVGIWVGNSSGAPTRRLTGAEGAGPMFADVMQRSMRDILTRAPLFDPSSLVEVDVCPLSGLPTGSACPAAVTRKLPAHKREALGKQVCDLHRHGHSPGRASRRRFECSARGTERAVVLPETYRGWLSAQPPGAPGRDPGGLPWLSDADTRHCTPPETSAVRLLEPRQGALLVTSDEQARVSVVAHANVQGPFAQHPLELEFVLNGRVAARASAPYRVELEFGRGDHELLVRPRDARLDLELASVLFSVR